MRSFRVSIILLAPLACLITVPAKVASAAFPNFGNYTLVQHSNDLGGSLLDFSGIAYRDDVDRLYIVSNNATAIHEYTTAGVFKRTITLTGFDDTEGVAYLGGDVFAIIEEKRKAITRLTIPHDPAASPANISLAKASGITMNPNLGTFGVDFDNSGTEDLTYNSSANKFYIVKEKDGTVGGTVAKGVYQVDNLAAGGTATTTQLAGVTATLAPLQLDLAGMYFNNQPGGHLYVQSHESKSVAELTLAGALVNTLALPAPSTQIEGITFSADGTHMFLIGEPREYLHYQLISNPSTVAASGVNNLNSFAVGNKRTFLTTDATTGSYAGLTSFTAAGGSVLGTTATIVQGKNATGAAETISMNWRDRSNLEKSGTATSPPSPVGFSSGLISDVMELSGMVHSSGTASPLGDRKRTDPFALQMSYSPSLLTGNEASIAAAGRIFLVWLDTEVNAVAGPQINDQWKNAVAGNFAVGTTVLTNQQMSWDAFALANSITDSNIGTFLGSWGVDSVGHSAWAVIDHNSQFAAVPEPNTVVILGLGAIGMFAFSRRNRQPS